jgi:hypothetical protein
LELQCRSIRFGFCFLDKNEKNPLSSIRCLASVASASRRFGPAVAAKASSQALQRVSALGERLRFSNCRIKNVFVENMVQCGYIYLSLEFVKVGGKFEAIGKGAGKNKFIS